MGMNLRGCANRELTYVQGEHGYSIIREVVRPSR